jgi:hypothetical protein
MLQSSPWLRASSVHLFLRLRQDCRLQTAPHALNGGRMPITKIRYVCGHEIDFYDGEGTVEGINSRRERFHAQGGQKCPACRDKRVRMQLVLKNRIHIWK